MSNSYSYLLFLVTMNRQSRPAVLPKVLGNVVGDTLRAHEDEDLGVFLRDLLEVLAELRPLLKVTYDLNDLLDVVVGSELHGADVDLNEVLQEVLWSKHEHPNCPLGSVMNVHWQVLGRPWAT